MGVRKTIFGCGKCNFHGYDSDFENVLKTSCLKGLLIPDQQTLIALNQLMIDIKTIGVYDKSDSFVVLALNSTNHADFSLVDWKLNKNIYLNIGSLEYTPYGYKGDGLAKYLHTNQYKANVNAIKYKLEDSCRMSVIFSVPTSPTVDNSSIDGTTASGLSGGEGSFGFSTVAQRINSANNPISPARGFTGTGLKVLGRTSNSATFMYNSGTYYNHTQTAQAIPNGAFTILNRGGRYSQNGISFYWIGAALSLTEINSFKVVFNNYLTSIGLSPIT